MSKQYKCKLLLWHSKSCFFKKSNWTGGRIFKGEFGFEFLYGLSFWILISPWAYVKLKCCFFKKSCEVFMQIGSI